MKNLRFLILVVITALTLPYTYGGCAGGGGGSDGSDPFIGLGLSNFYIEYTHIANIETWEWGIDWYVENEDGSVRGPFDSGGTGFIDLGQDSRNTANITRALMGGFYYTYMNVPVGPVDYYTGDMTGNYTTLKITLENAVIGEEMRLAYASDMWWSVTANPFTFSQSIFSTDIMGYDDLANAFVSYRSTSAEEPLIRYGYKLDFPESEIGRVTLNVNNFKTCVSKGWSSTEDLTTDLPFVIAQRKGAMFSWVGDSVDDGSGIQGTFGLADQFPADHWYLASGSIMPDVVAEFDPAAITPVTLKPFDRYIDDTGMLVNSTLGTFTVSVPARFGYPGTDPIHYGMLRLIKIGSPTISWEIYFPWSIVTEIGNEGTLQLPALPGYPTLPDFDTIMLELYRLDGSTTADAMLQYYLDHKENAYPSFARISEST